MLKATNAEIPDPRCGRGSAQRAAGGADPAPGGAGHGHCVPARGPAQPVDIAVSARGGDRHAHGLHHLSAGDPAAKVLTVEHLMSACAGLGMDNLLRGCHRRGSSHPRWRRPLPLLFLLQSAGHRAAECAASRFIRVEASRVEVRDGAGANEKWARLEPYHGYKLRFEIEFNHPAVDSTGPARGVRFRAPARTRATSPARAPSASPRTWR